MLIHPIFPLQLHFDCIYAAALMDIPQLPHEQSV